MAVWACGWICWFGSFSSSCTYSLVHLPARRHSLTLSQVSSHPPANHLAPPLRSARMTLRGMDTPQGVGHTTRHDAHTHAFCRSYARSSSALLLTLERPVSSPSFEFQHQRTHTHWFMHTIAVSYRSPLDTHAHTNIQPIAPLMSSGIPSHAPQAHAHFRQRVGKTCSLCLSYNMLPQSSNGDLQAAHADCKACRNGIHPRQQEQHMQQQHIQRQRRQTLQQQHVQMQHMVEPDHLGLTPEDLRVLASILCVDNDNDERAATASADVRRRTADVL